ncbi:MAG: hypothetical protein ISR69_01460 [Gammaproteobacteria bacterium]|nr:hypothetical protein [Gammaproteobacteria bacterium]
MSSSDQQVEALEKSILERAKILADEHVHQGNLIRLRVLDNSREKIHLMEQKEVLSAKNNADREYRRLVQANEIQMQAELDKNRWGLVQSALDSLSHELEQLVANEEKYLPVFEKLLKHAVKSINKDKLQIKVNDSDYKRFVNQWDEIVSRSCADKKAILSKLTCNCLGGVVAFSEDGKIKVDNTFESLIERKQKQLQQVIVERLFPAVKSMKAKQDG